MCFCSTGPAKAGPAADPTNSSVAGWKPRLCLPSKRFSTTLVDPNLEVERGFDGGICWNGSLTLCWKKYCLNMCFEKMTVQQMKETFLIWGDLCFIWCVFCIGKSAYLSSCHHFNWVQKSQKNVRKLGWNSSFISMTASLCLAQLYTKLCPRESLVLKVVLWLFYPLEPSLRPKEITSFWKCKLSAWKKHKAFLITAQRLPLQKKSKHVPPGEKDNHLMSSYK